MPLGKSVQISGFVPFDGKGLLAWRRFCVTWTATAVTRSNERRLSTLARTIHEVRLTFLVNSPISLRLNPMRSARQSCAAFTLSFRNDP